MSKRNTKTKEGENISLSSLSDSKPLTAAAGYVFGLWSTQMSLQINIEIK